MMRTIMRRVALTAILLATGRATAEEDAAADFSCTNAAGEVIAPLDAEAVSVTSGENGVALDITKDDVTNIMVVVECSGLTAGAAGARALFMTHTVTNGADSLDREGLLLTPDGSLQGVWSGNIWGDAAGAVPLDGARMHLVLHYDTQRGVAAYAVRDGACQLLYWHDGLRSSFETIRGVTVGGGFGDSFAPCAGLAVHALAVYEADLAGCALDLGDSDEVVIPDYGATMECEQDGVTWRYTVSQNAAAVRGALTIPEAMRIPTSLAGFPTTAIGEKAFFGVKGIKSLTIPSCIARIGQDAFKGNGSTLETLVIEEGVRQIGSWTFGYSSKLKSVSLPKSLTRIMGYAFRSCGALTEVEIPSGAINCGAFSKCSALESVTIGSGVTSLGQWGGDGSGWAFLECAKLNAVHISDLAAWCAMDIYDETSNPLYYAHNLYLNGELVTDLVIPDGVTRIPARAFYGATCLRSVTLPDSVTSKYVV